MLGSTNNAADQPGERRLELPLAEVREERVRLDLLDVTETPTCFIASWNRTGASARRLLPVVRRERELELLAALVEDAVAVGVRPPGLGERGFFAAATS